MILSIVIPTYRRNETLLPLLVEVLSQSKHRSEQVEIIVVDNAADATTRELVDGFGDGVVYIAAPERGIANARNAGVSASKGEYIIFVDDDQYPAPGWFEAYFSAAMSGGAAYFGKVSARLVSPPQSHLSHIVTALFSRTFDAEANADIKWARARLGTGNSMFSRDRCFNRGLCFDSRFNEGGEDVFFLRQLSAQPAITFNWCPEAMVFEVVPSERTYPRYLMRRRFRNGQLRTRVEALGGGPLPAAFWMAAGLAQVLGRGIAAATVFPFDKEVSLAYWIDSQGGLGKLLWFV